MAAGKNFRMRGPPIYHLLWNCASITAWENSGGGSIEKSNIQSEFSMMLPVVAEEIQRPDRGLTKSNTLFYSALPPEKPLSSLRSSF
jgi:hypothetical protein